MAKNYLAFDIGGTSIKYAVVDQDCQILHQGKKPTNHNLNQTIIKTLQQVSSKLMQSYQLDGIGISTAGRVGADGSIIYAGPTITDYQGTQLKKILAEQTHLPVHVVNDVDAALLGEILLGDHDRKQPIYCVALGTGIGGAFYLNGQLLNGAHGLANSVGYLNYDPVSHSTFESQASTLALEGQLKAVHTTVPEAFAKARQGNQQFQKIIADWCDDLGQQLAIICLLLDPATILIGGAVSQQGDFLIDQIQAAVNRHLPEGLAKVKIQATTLQEKAQIFGAISHFFEWKRIHFQKDVLL